jgi:hypothetical protein
MLKDKTRGILSDRPLLMSEIKNAFVENMGVILEKSLF